MNAAQARKQMELADEMLAQVAVMTAKMKSDARWNLTLPLPGAIVRDVRTKRLFRVVINGDLRTLDTLTNAGIQQFEPDWTQYDIEQDGT